MRARIVRYLLAIVFLFIVWQIWARVRIVVFARITDLILLLAVLALGFVLLEHYLNRNRG